MNNNIVIFVKALGRQTVNIDVHDFYKNKSSTAAELGDRLATLDMDRKLRGVPIFGQGGAGPSSNTMSPGPRPNCVPSGILMHLAVWP